MFDENKLLIPLKEILGLSLIPNIKEKEIFEHFTEEDYKKINDKIKGLKEFNQSILNKIKKKEEDLKKLETKNDAYQTFIHMFDNIQERNESYYKTLLLLITIIFILILCIVSYYMKKNN